MQEGCFGHILHLAVGDGLQELEAELESCRKLCSFIKVSNKARDAIDEQQTLMKEHLGRMHDSSYFALSD